MNSSGIQALLDDISALLAGSSGRSGDLRRALASQLYPDHDAAGLAECFTGEDLGGFWRSWRHPSGGTRQSVRCASGAVTLRAARHSGQTFEPGELTIEHATTSAEYVNITGGQLVSGGSLSVRVEALVAGEAGTAAPGTLTVLNPGVSGVNVTNESPVIGADAWTDAEYRAALLSDDALSRAARSARSTGGTLVGATRAREVSVYRTSVYVAGPSGGITSENDLALLRRALGLDIGSPPLAAKDVALTVDVDLTVDDGSAPNNTALENTVLASVSAHISAIPIGGVVYIDAIDTAARAGFGMKANVAGSTLSVTAEAAYVTSLAVTAPVADVVLAASEVATLGTLNVNITRV